MSNIKSFHNRAENLKEAMEQEITIWKAEALKHPVKSKQREDINDSIERMNNAILSMENVIEDLVG